MSHTMYTISKHNEGVQHAIVYDEEREEEVRKMNEE